MYCAENRKDFPTLSLFASLPDTVINPQWLELPMSRTVYHVPKDVRAIEVRLYFCQLLTLMPFLNQQKGEKDHRNYFMIKLHESYGAGTGIELATSGSAVRHVTDCYDMGSFVESAQKVVKINSSG